MCGSVCVGVCVWLYMCVWVWVCLDMKTLNINSVLFFESKVLTLFNGKVCMCLSRYIELFWST